MSLTDYLPSPNSALKGLTGLFQKREGQPWLQGVARNLGHAAFGDKIGNYVDQNYLGDPTPGQMSPSAGLSGLVAQPQTALKPIQQQPQANADGMKQALAAWLQIQGGQ